MKNLIATAVSVLALGFAAPAMAQTNSSTINQLGSSQTVNVDQIGAAANNSSTVSQGLNWGGSADNTANIGQAGTVGMNNISNAIQDGWNNLLKLDQSGNGFDGDVNFSYTNQAGSDNQIEVVQGNLVTDNTSLIDQYGNDNVAKVQQGGGLGENLINDSSIDQDGSANHATVHQGGAGVVSNSSFVAQGGGGNIANVNQH